MPSPTKVQLIDNGAVDSTAIKNSSIDTIDIANGAVTSDKIAGLNVTTAKIADFNVTTAKIADSNVTTAKIAGLAVTTGNIADSNVTTAKIANSNVTTAKIADSNVTFGKIHSDSYRTSAEGIRSVDSASDTEFATEKAIASLAASLTGRILKIITGTTSTEVTHTTGETFTPTGLYANITPSSVNSKIIILTNQPCSFNEDEQGRIILRRDRVISVPPENYQSDSSNLFTASYGTGTAGGGGTAQSRSNILSSIIYIDSPNTTLRVTYSTFGKAFVLDDRFTTNSRGIPIWGSDLWSGTESSTSLIYLIEISG